MTKKQTPQQQAKIRDWEQEASSSSLAERFPTVEKIDLVARSRPLAGGLGPAQDKARTYSTSDKAYFKTSCPWRDCIAGGVDYDSIIRGMIDKKESSNSSHAVCVGTTDRANKSPCALVWDYTISITFK